MATILLLVISGSGSLKIYVGLWIIRAYDRNPYSRRILKEYYSQ